jgi:RimJ/RimL family protein N-acetyltransferase
MVLEAGRCQIRSWRFSDLSSLVRHADNPAIWRNVRDGFPSPYREGDAEQWLLHAASAEPETNFAIAVGDQAVGAIGLSLQADIHRVSAEIGYWLAEEYWGQGIMTCVVRAFTAHAFATHELSRLFAYVFEWNTASARVLEKAGFVLEARLRKSAIKGGRIIDEFQYGLVR